ncbi:MAG TPA: hypothetical protein VMX36_05280 [Sedimentisphaerales bacterium]|nr:hypothetical protein [Sedimentisphaerales bacterium]
MTNIACHHERLRQAKYEHEKTKNGQITHSPHAGAISECTTAQTNAYMTASGTCRFVINDNIQSPPPMSNVSNSEPTMTSPMSRPMAGPLKFGPVSSVTTPVNPKIIAIMSEGIRLISPMRRIYFHIEI